MRCITRRARSEAQKDERRRQILAAASARLEHAGFEQILLSEVAADVGMTKAALYRYFSNKEELFLALYEDALSQLVAQVGAWDGPTSGLAAGFSEAILTTPHYGKLSAILHSVLEQNLSPEHALAFKIRLHSQFEHLCRSVMQQTGWAEALATERLMQVQQAVIGCWHMGHPPAKLRALMLADARLLPLLQDYPKALHAHLLRIFAP